MARFLGWQRSSTFRMATGAAAQDPRLAGAVTVELDDGSGPLTGVARFLFAGPGDVSGIAGDRIGQRYPHPGSLDAEQTKAAYVELLDPDLPWRYSPEPNPALGAGRVRPWIVLVVGTPDEVRVTGDRVTLVGRAVLDAHPLPASAQWAHVHDLGDRRVARILCPRSLAGDGGEWIAVLVPAWQVIDVDGVQQRTDSWDEAVTQVTLPAYHSWGFRTHAQPGDFATLAQALKPVSVEERRQLDDSGFGRARVAVHGLPGKAQTTSGALSTIPQPGADPIEGPPDAEVEQALEPLTFVDPGPPWTLTAPRYDAPWHPGPVDGQEFVWPLSGEDVAPPGWRRQMRVEPRYRGAAGLGAWNAIAWQDRIADAAAAQAGAVALAATRIRHLVAGLQAGRSLWNRRMPADNVAKLAVLGPMLARVPAAGGGSVLDATRGRTPALRPALFSSAAQRLVRRRSAVRREAGDAADLAGLIRAANTCPDEPAVDDLDADAQRQLQDEDRVAGLAERIWQNFGGLLEGLDLGEQGWASLEAAVGDHEAIAEAAGLLARPSPDPWCRPLLLEEFASSVVGGVDPTVEWPVAAERVLSGFEGLREPLLAEPEVAPELDIPLWSFLNDNSRDWMLAGAGDIPADRVMAVQTNPVFVDAYLIGANHQTLGELRWRNLPITTRWTPLRRFWQRIDPQADAVATDIRPVVSLATDTEIWPEASLLGDPSHQTTTQNVSLVIVVHSPLFRRYPATLIYLVPNDGPPDPWTNTPPLATPQERPRHFPIFTGRMTPDMVFFGFDLPPQAITTHWVVLEEPPRGLRFDHPDEVVDEAPPGPHDDAAQYAAKTFAEPVRVFLGNMS